MVKNLPPKTRSQNKELLLRRLWYDPSSTASYGGIRRLYLAGKRENSSITLSEVQKFLQSQQTYLLFRRRRKKFPRNRFITPGPGISVSIDLWSMQTYASANNGYSYIVLAIDNFSRKAVGVPIKKKDLSEILQALKAIVKVLPMKILISDQERAILSSKVQAFLTENNIFHMTNLNSGHAIMAERLIGSLSIRLARAMKAMNGTWTWHSNQLLAKLIKSYNSTKHSSLARGKYAPDEINDFNSYKVYDFQVQNKPPGMRPKLIGNKVKFKLGDRVVISSIPNSFDKQLYVPTHKEEIFIIKKINTSGKRVTYNLKSSQDEPIQGSFYQDEIVKVDASGELEKGPGTKILENKVKSL